MASVINKDTFGVAAQLGLSALAGMEASKPGSFFKYIWTYEVAAQSVNRLSQYEWFPLASTELSYQEFSVYFAVLNSLFKGVLEQAVDHHEALLTLFSTPMVVHQVVKSSPFQELLTKIRNNEFQKVKELYQKIAEEYILDSKALYPSGDQKLSASLEEQLRLELTEKASHDIDQFIQVIRSSLSKDIDQITGDFLNQFDSIKDGSIEFISTFPSSILINRHFQSDGDKILAPIFHERVLNGYYLGAKTNPALAPLLFVNAKPDLAELMIRASSACASVFFNQPLLATISAECALKLVPESIKQHSINQAVSHSLMQVREDTMNRFSGAIEQYENRRLEEGATVEMVAQEKLEILQASSAGLLVFLSRDTNPALIAFSTPGFCAQIAAFLANHGIAKPEQFFPTVDGRGYLVYRIAVMGGAVLADEVAPRLAVQFFASAASLPFVSDAVLSNRYVQAGGSAASSVMESGNQLYQRMAGTPSETLPPLDAEEKVEHPWRAAGIQALKDIGRVAYRVMITSQSIYVSGQYLGAWMGALTPLIGKHSKTAFHQIVLGVTGISASYLSSNDSLATALAVESVDEVLSSREFEKTAQFVNDCREEYLGC